MKGLKHAGCLVIGMLLLAQTPLSGSVGRSESLSRRPVPRLPPPAVTRPDSVWVPDRYISIPGEPGLAHVPGHWERQVSPTENYTPPLTACNPTTGTCVTTPGGLREPPARRLESP